MSKLQHNSSPGKKKKDKHFDKNTKGRIASSAQIEQKMEKLKEILNKQNLTHRTNKNSILSNGSIVSRKNRPTTITINKSIESNLQGKNSKQKYRHFEDKNGDKNVKKLSSKAQFQPNSKLLKHQNLRSDSIEQSKKTPDRNHKKKNKKILSYLNQSSDFEHLQKRLQKFKPTKSNQEYKNTKNSHSSNNIAVEDFIIDDIRDENSQNLSQSDKQSINVEDLFTQQEKVVRSRFDVQSTDNSSQLLPNVIQSVSLLNTHKNSMNNTQAFTVTEPSELYSCLLPLQSKHDDRNLNNQRKNISCLSNFSNFSNHYLKPIHQEKIYKSKILNPQQNYKTNNTQKNKPLVSFSLLLSRRNTKQGKMLSAKFSDHIKYDNWLKIKKSKNYQDKNSKSKYTNDKIRHKYKKNLKSGQKQKSSKRKESLSAIKRRNKERSLSSCFRNQKQVQLIESRDKKILKRLNLQEDIKESSRSEKKTFKSLKEDLKVNKNSHKKLIMAKSTQLGKSISSRYLNKLSCRANKQSGRLEQQTQSVDSHKENAIRQLHRKYEIQQLSMRLRQQLKKITLAIKQSDTGRKSSNKNSGRKHINNSSSKKSCKYLQDLIGQKSLQDKSIDLKFYSDANKKSDNKQSKFYHQNDSCPVKSWSKAYENLSLSDKKQSIKYYLENDDNESLQIQNLEPLKFDRKASVLPLIANKQSSFDSNEFNGQESQIQIERTKKKRKGCFSGNMDGQSNLVEEEQVILIGQNQFDDGLPSPKSINHYIQHTNHQCNSSNFEEKNEQKYFRSEQKYERVQIKEESLSLNQLQRPPSQLIKSEASSLTSQQTESQINHQLTEQQIKNKVFAVDIRKPQTVYYDNLQNDFIFTNSSYEQFIRNYSSLLIQVAHTFSSYNQTNTDPTDSPYVIINETRSNDQLKQKTDSQLIKNLSKPLGTPTLNLLRMMAENSRNFANTSSLNPRSIAQSSKDQDQAQGVEQIDQVDEADLKNSAQMRQQQSFGKDSIMLESNKKHNQSSPSSMLGTPYIQQQIQEDTGSEYAISPEIYYFIQSHLVDSLEHFSTEHSMLHADKIKHDHRNDQSINPNIQNLTQFRQLAKLLHTIYTKTQLMDFSSESSQENCSIVEFYEEYLKPYSLAVYDLTNAILDELRPYGTKGQPPINLYQGQASKLISKEQIQQFLIDKLNQQVFAIKLGLMVQNIECRQSTKNAHKLIKTQIIAKDVINKSQKVQKNENGTEEQSDAVYNQQSKKRERLGQVISKYLQKQAYLINRQLQFQYGYLQDVKFQILYEIWTQVQSLIIEEETSLLISYVF